jgi:hypothetical protein
MEQLSCANARTACWICKLCRMQILQLASVREVEAFYVKGDTIRDTVDIRTDAGYEA